MSAAATNGHSRGYNPMGLDPLLKPVDPRPLNLTHTDNSLVVEGEEAKRAGLSNGDPVCVQRVLVGKPPSEPTVAERIRARLCPDGHLDPVRAGYCPRCGTRP